jgi:rod shape-determining protein MreC
MQFIDQLLQKRREKITLAICVLVSLILLFMPGRFKMPAAERVLDAVLYPSVRLAAFLDDYHEMRDENRRLKRMVASLMIEREKLMQFKRERARLRKLAALKEEQFYKLVPCEVIGRNLDRFQDVLVIDKGADDSLRVKMPVLSYQGFVGKITKVFGNSSHVQLITSRNSPVSCLDKRSRVVGILEWIQGDEFSLKDVGINEDIRKGDTLITSGYGGVVPKGFPVAVVKSVLPDQDRLTLNVHAEGILNLSAIEEVFVIVDEMPWEKGIFYDERDKVIYESSLEDKR